MANRSLQKGSPESANITVHGTSKDEISPNPPQKQNGFKRIWVKSGLTTGVLIMMFKSALPPTIALAIYQSSEVAAVYSTLGYLPAIISVLSFAIMPRSKFLQTMLLNIVGTCIGAAIALLQIYCSVQARAHSTQKLPNSSSGPSPGAVVSGYNSSASAVSAIWLFFNIYLANTLRASRPQLQLPVIMYSIFANVAGIYTPSFPTMDAGISFAKRLLEAFLTGFGIATAVSLLVIPSTTRTSWFGQSAGFMKRIQSALKTEVSCFRCLERGDIFNVPEFRDDPHKEGSKKHQEPRVSPSPAEAEMEKLKATLKDLGELMGKMQGDLTFAKREMAWGKLNASDLDELFKHIQRVYMPLMGMASTVDIFQRLAKRRGWSENHGQSSDAQKNISEKIKTQWNDVMVSMHDPFESITSDIIDGVQHALYTLELLKRPRAKKGQRSEEAATQPPKISEDVEASAGAIGPGEHSFGEHLVKRFSHKHEPRSAMIKALCEKNGVELSARDLSVHTGTIHGVGKERSSLTEDQLQQQSQKAKMLFVLYLDYLLCSTGKAVLSLVKFADRKVEQGTMKKNRLITPGFKRLKKWGLSLLKHTDSTTEHAPDSAENASTVIVSGSSFGAEKDPEHLAPTTAWQKSSDIFRIVGQMLASQESAFGFRVACATMSIAIIAYLEQTRSFFLAQRLVWSMIMVAIGMTLTAGNGIFGFIGRIVGTFLAMCTSFIIWYIVNGSPVGVLVFMWLFIFVETYFLIVYPKLVVVALILIVTQVLIVGYELEVKKVGLKVATSNGQPAYPIFQLAPYRLACVAGGMAVAFFWTFFPYPLTARSQVRKELGHSLYLLAKFHSIVHTTCSLNIRGAEGDVTSKESPGRKLDKARREVYVKELALLAGIKQNSAFTAWEPNFGGKFPKDQYDAIIQETQSILNYLALIAYASNTFSHNATEPSSAERAPWIDDFARLISSIEITSQSITSTLTLLAASVTNGTPLPPHLKAPQPYKLSHRLKALDPEILSVKHLDEPGYAAFAVMQIASSLVSDDLEKLIANVRSLVGEVDFTFEFSRVGGDALDLMKGKED